MMRGMFDNLIEGLVIFGICIGLAVAGLIWLLVWLWQHVRIEWLS